MNLTDIILIFILAVLVLFAVRSIIKRRSGCSGDCSGCKHCGEKCPKNDKSVR